MSRLNLAVPLVLVVLIVAAVILGSAALGDGGVSDRASANFGDEARGRQLVQTYGCTSCHAIDGVGRGQVGPPLDGLSGRAIIAGELPNTPENLTRWIRDPRSIEPGTVMPDLGVTEQEARDIVSYLYTLD